MNRIFPVPSEPGQTCEICAKQLGGDSFMLAQDRGTTVFYTHGHAACLKAKDRLAVINETHYRVTEREWFHGQKDWLEIKKEGE